MATPWSWRMAPRDVRYKHAGGTRGLAPPCRCCKRAGIKRHADVNTAHPQVPANSLCFGCADDRAIRIADCRHGAPEGGSAGGGQ